MKPAPKKIFCSYAHEDEDIMQALRAHLASLRQTGQIEDWHDRQIPAGGDWAQEIETQLNAADIVLLLISSDFINSSYCMQVETRRALQRIKEDNISVIPIFARECVFKGLSFAPLQGTPIDCRWITQQASQDKAYSEVVKKISEVLSLPDVMEDSANNNPPDTDISENKAPITKPPLFTHLLVLLSLGFASWGAYQYFTPMPVNPWDSLLMQGEYHSADKACSVVPQSAENYSAAQACQAISQLMLDEGLNTEAFFAKAQAIDKNHPKPPYALVVMAEAYAANQRWDKAETAYKLAIQRAPNFAQAHFGLGQIKQAQNQPILALEYYQQALKISPENRRFLHNLASLYSELGQYPQAGEKFDQLLQRDGSSLLAYVEWVEVLQLQGKFTQALNLAEHLQTRLNTAEIWQMPLNKVGWFFKMGQKSVYFYTQFDKQNYIQLQYVLSAFLANKSVLAESLLQSLSRQTLNQGAVQLTEYNRLRLNQLYSQQPIPVFFRKSVEKTKRVSVKK